MVSRFLPSMDMVNLIILRVDNILIETKVQVITLTRLKEALTHEQNHLRRYNNAEYAR